MSRVRCFGAFAAAGFIALAMGALAARGVARAQSSGPAPSGVGQPSSAISVSAPTTGPTAPTAAPGPPRMSGGVAALVNDDVISTYDLRQRALLYLVTTGTQPTQENLPQIQQEALRSLIDEHLELQELKKMEKAQKFEIVADDEEVGKSLQQIVSENNSNLAELQRQFSRVGLDVQTLKDQIRVQISWSRMISGRYGTRVRIGDNQVNMALQRIKAAANQPQYQVSEIFIDAARAGGMADAVSGAGQLILQIQQGAPFAPVARQFSSAPTAASGGDMGWISAAELQPELAHALEQMRPGQLSEPIQVSDGVYVLQLRDKRSGAAGTTVNLKQAAVRLPAGAPQDQIDAASKTLDAVRATGATCADLEAKAATVAGAVAGDLGQSEVTELAPEFRTAAEGLALNQFSQPVRTAVGLHLIMVCDRHETKAAVPTKQEVENRLYSEQLAMLSRRSLRDLRNSATIETP